MLTLWRPFGGLFRTSRELDDLYWGKARNGNRVDFAPAVDIEEQEDHFLVSADLPGVSDKEIEVKVEDGVLLISGKRESTEEKRTESGTYRERRFGSFMRSFTLGKGVDASKIEATYANGVLAVKVPKAEETKPRQIPVSTN